MKKISIREISLVAMLSAVSFILVLVGRLIPNVAGFLSYDPKDAIVVIAGFMLGPIASVIISVAVSFLEFISISGTGIWGLLMNILSTCAFAVPAALIYKRSRTMKSALIGLAISVCFMSGCMVLWNYLITPFYMKVPRSVIVDMLLPVFLPFNLVKGGLNMALTMLLYKPLVTALRKARLLPEGSGNKSKTSSRIIFLLAGLFLLITFLLLFLIFADVL